MRKKIPLTLLLALFCLGSSLTLGACGGEESGSDDPQGTGDASTPVPEDDASTPGPEPVPEGALRVSVIDELTGRPVLGATVLATVDGAEIALPQQADERYQAALDTEAAATVSVFHADYHYVTVAGVKSSDLVVALRRLPGARRGGLSGKLTNWPESSDTIAVGIAGLSLQGNILDFEPALYRGDARQATFTLPSWISSLVGGFAANIPTEFQFNAPGAVMIGDQASYAVLGMPSPCGDEAAEKAGTCGKQAAFSAYASVSGLLDPTVQALLTPETTELIKAIIDGVQSEAGLDIAALIPKALPMLPKILSVLSFDYAEDLSLQFGGADQALAARDFTTTKKFDLKRSVTLPAPPILMGEAPADLVGALALADLGGQGLIPLGAGASQADELTFDMTLANVGSGLDAAGRKILALALDSGISGAMSDDTVPLTFSALLESFEALSEAGTAMSGSFLAAPADSTFDAASRTLGDLPAVEGATLYRAVLKGADRRWVVYYGDDSARVTLPAVPSGFEDVIAADQRHTLIALRLGDGVTFESLFADDEANPDRLGDLMNAFSISVH